VRVIKELGRKKSSIRRGVKGNYPSTTRKESTKLKTKKWEREVQFQTPAVRKGLVPSTIFTKREENMEATGK